MSQNNNSNPHEKIEKNVGLMAVLIAVVISFGGLAEIVPLMFQADAVEPAPGVEPYPPLELAGREVYVREGCYNCHSQMIRTLVPDVMRYGTYSRLGESVYDYPSQIGSRRIGPDLARVGGKYGDEWHYQHMEDPRSITDDSNMPNYPWLMTKRTNINALPAKIAVQRRLGVPFPEMTDAEILEHANMQAQEIVDGLREKGIYTAPDRQIVALIAYLQQLGISRDLPAR